MIDFELYDKIQDKILAAARARLQADDKHLTDREAVYQVLEEEFMKLPFEEQAVLSGDDDSPLPIWWLVDDLVYLYDPTLPPSDD